MHVAPYTRIVRIEPSVKLQPVVVLMGTITPSMRIVAWPGFSSAESHRIWRLPPEKPDRVRGLARGRWSSWRRGCDATR